MFSPLPGETIQFDEHIFFNGAWFNHHQFRTMCFHTKCWASRTTKPMRYYRGAQGIILCLLLGFLQIHGRLYKLFFWVSHDEPPGKFSEKARAGYVKLRVLPLWKTGMC